MKRGLLLVFIYLLGVGASAQVATQEIEAAQVALKVEHHGIIQAVGGIEFAEGSLQFFNGKCLQSYSVTYELCVRKSIPVIISGLRLGAGLKFSAQQSYGGSYMIYLANWSGKTVYDLFGQYFGINGAEIDLAMFGLRGLTAFGMNSSGVSMSKMVSGYVGADQGGYGINIASLRVLSVWPGDRWVSYDSSKDEIYKSTVITRE